MFVQKASDVRDHYTFLGNCPATPPLWLSQHFALSVKVGLREGWADSLPETCNDPNERNFALICTKKTIKIS